LFAVDWRELFHRLEFYNFAAFHDRPRNVIEKKRVLTRRRGGRGGRGGVFQVSSAQIGIEMDFVVISSNKETYHFFLRVLRASA
jgi:hypothetical protein